MPPRAYSFPMVDEARKDGGGPRDDNVIDVRVRLPGGIHTKDAIEGRHSRLSRSDSADSLADLPVTISIPSIKGEVMRRLREADPRDDDDDLDFDGDERFELDGQEEAGAVAIALVLLENIGRHAGTRVPMRDVRGVLERLLPTLSARELMSVEREAYRTMQWLGEAIDPAMDDDVEPPPERVGPETNLELILRAIRAGFDLEMEYFTGARTELTQRRITPHSVEAERYLHAYCHKRQDDRVFRLSRIGRMWPAGGYTAPKNPAPQATPARQERDPGSQLSLLATEEDEGT